MQTSSSIRTKKRWTLTLWSASGRTSAGSGWAVCPGRWSLAVLWYCSGSDSGQWCRGQLPRLPASCHQTWRAAPGQRCSCHRPRRRSLWIQETTYAQHFGKRLFYMTYIDLIELEWDSNMNQHYLICWDWIIVGKYRIRHVYILNVGLCQFSHVANCRLTIVGKSDHWPP